MEERKPLVSVIVPVYNVYPYLRDCVQSVQAQSYQNWELLLVDDGSTDGSGELCDELAVEDGRIRVFHKPNGGQSDARNVGLQQTQGKYFYLLDSDDLIRSTAFDQFVERCEADGADAALTPLEMFSTEQPEGRTENPHQIPELLNREETMRRMLLHQGIGHGAGGVFFRREVWGDLQFPVGILYEDYAVMYRAIARCAKVEVFPEPMYDYRIHTGSTMKSGIGAFQLNAGLQRFQNEILVARFPVCGNRLGCRTLFGRCHSARLLSRFGIVTLVYHIFVDFQGRFLKKL